MDTKTITIAWTEENATPLVRDAVERLELLKMMRKTVSKIMQKKLQQTIKRTIQERRKK